MLKKKSIYTKYPCLLLQFFFPSLPNLGAQIRCAQSLYAAIQTDLQYPLQTDIKVFFLRWGVLALWDIVKCESHFLVLHELFFCC